LEQALAKLLNLTPDKIPDRIFQRAKTRVRVRYDDHLRKMELRAAKGFGPKQSTAAKTKRLHLDLFLRTGISWPRSR
jgi:hypothetical protein